MKNISAILLLSLVMGLATPAAFAEGMGVDESYINDLPEEEYSEGEEEMPAEPMGNIEDVEEAIDASREAIGNSDSRNPDTEW